MNWYIALFAASFWIELNSYFGWNWTPKSEAELISEGIFVLLAALAYVGK
jgi:hypothetical protein